MQLVTTFSVMMLLSAPAEINNNAQNKQIQKAQIKGYESLQSLSVTGDLIKTFNNSDVKVSQNAVYPFIDPYSSEALATPQESGDDGIITDEEFYSRIIQQ